MSQLLKSIFILSLTLLFIPFPSFSQDLPPKDSTNVKLMTAAREIMTAAGTCALITLDKEDRPRVRVMDPFLPESDFTVWFGTNSKSRKVDQINNNPKVTLYYLDSDSSGYVMIHGTAQLVNDQKEKEKMVNKSIDMSYFIYSRYSIIQKAFNILLKLTKIQGADQMKFRKTI